MRERITVRMTAEMIARIDAWIAEQAGYVSRQGAVRRMVESSLTNGGPCDASNDTTAPHRSPGDAGRA